MLIDLLSGPLKGGMMEDRDIQLIEKYRTSDEDLSQLYQEHLDLERELERFNNKSYLSPNEELERKQIQKKKLMGKDRIETILRKYRELENMS
jgi:uncharacterized protein YdcH (DUF465 family)